MRGRPDRIRGAKGKKVNSGTGMVSVLHSVIEEDCRRQDTDKFRCRRVVSVSSGLMRDSLGSAVWAAVSSTKLALKPNIHTDGFIGLRRTSLHLINL